MKKSADKQLFFDFDAPLASPAENVPAEPAAEVVAVAEEVVAEAVVREAAAEVEVLEN